MNFRSWTAGVLQLEAIAARDALPHLPSYGWSLEIDSESKLPYMAKSTSIDQSSGPEGTWRHLQISRKDNHKRYILICCTE